MGVEEIIKDLFKYFNKSRSIIMKKKPTVPESQVEQKEDKSLLTLALTLVGVFALQVSVVVTLTSKMDKMQSESTELYESYMKSMNSQLDGHTRMLLDYIETAKLSNKELKTWLKDKQGAAQNVKLPYKGPKNPSDVKTCVVVLPEADKNKPATVKFGYCGWNIEVSNEQDCCEKWFGDGKPQ